MGRQVQVVKLLRLIAERARLSGIDKLSRSSRAWHLMELVALNNRI